LGVIRTRQSTFIEVIPSRNHIINVEFGSNYAHLFTVKGKTSYQHGTKEVQGDPKEFFIDSMRRRIVRN
jgi:hypothetical protein